MLFFYVRICFNLIPNFK